MIAVAVAVAVIVIIVVAVREVYRGHERGAKKHAGSPVRGTSPSPALADTHSLPRAASSARGPSQ